MRIEPRSFLLKSALFATGFSGIVSEYVLATLASYFLGDSIVQWAIVISLMLFFMGIGARVTRKIEKNAFTWLIISEFALSIIVSLSALATYIIAAYSEATVIMIYGIAATTGCLIGMELPLAIRLNDQFEVLQVNVSNILEKDYYGSLLGGVFFVFLGLPYLGLANTPIVLGLINLSVGIALLNVFPAKHSSKKIIGNGIGILLFIGISTSFFYSDEIIQFGEQKNYADKVIYEDQTRYQKIVITQWKNDYWLYLNRNLQFSTFDEPLYHEVIVHPVLALHPLPQQVLVLGGGDGCAVRELLKHHSVERIDLVDLDPKMTELGLEHDVLISANDSSLHSPIVNITNDDALHYVDTTHQYYDIIIVDLPDPRSVELSRLYSVEFYTKCKRHMRPSGAIITQAGSPYFAPASFECIDTTMKTAGFQTLPMHNNIMTMGEWGWMIGSLDTANSSSNLSDKIHQYPYEKLELKWLNKSASKQLTSFGKPYFKTHVGEIQPNYIHDPVLYRYYLNGTWDLY